MDAGFVQLITDECENAPLPNVGQHVLKIRLRYHYTELHLMWFLTLGCEKFLPVRASLLLSKTGPHFRASL